MIIKFRKLFPDAVIPQRASAGAVGYDVTAYHVISKQTRKKEYELPYTIFAGGSVLFGIGISFALHLGVDCQVRPRSGLASKFDIELGNSPGTVDPDYRGEISVLLRNRSQADFVIEKGMRIAQLVFTHVELPDLVEEETLPETVRDTGGFGSTGLHEISESVRKEIRQGQIEIDKYFMSIVRAIAEKSDCLRPDRKFGCLITREDKIISAGFNNMTFECNTSAGCIRDTYKMSTGHDNDRGCVHAEEAAILNHAHLGGRSLENTTLYVNAEPCIKCAKMIVQSGIKTVVVPGKIYPINGVDFLEAHGVEVRTIV
jgi:dUTP pyrophosphatase